MFRALTWELYLIIQFSNFYLPRIQRAAVYYLVKMPGRQLWRNISHSFSLGFQLIISVSTDFRFVKFSYLICVVFSIVKVCLAQYNCYSGFLNACPNSKLPGEIDIIAGSILVKIMSSWSMKSFQQNNRLKLVLREASYIENPKTVLSCYSEMPRTTNNKINIRFSFKCGLNFITHINASLDCVFYA